MENEKHLFFFLERVGALEEAAWSLELLEACDSCPSVNFVKMLAVAATLASCRE
jgi:hypothetical protein